MPGNVFGNAGGPCIIILTRGRNELFFSIIFKEKAIFCSLFFYLFYSFFLYVLHLRRAMMLTKPTRLFSGVNYDKSCRRLLTKIYGQVPWLHQLQLLHRNKNIYYEKNISKSVWMLKRVYVRTSDNRTCRITIYNFQFLNIL